MGSQGQQILGCRKERASYRTTKHSSSQISTSPRVPLGDLGFYNPPHPWLPQNRKLNLPLFSIRSRTTTRGELRWAKVMGQVFFHHPPLAHSSSTSCLPSPNGPSHSPSLSSLSFFYLIRPAQRGVSCLALLVSPPILPVPHW